MRNCPCIIYTCSCITVSYNNHFLCAICNTILLETSNASIINIDPSVIKLSLYHVAGRFCNSLQCLHVLTTSYQQLMYVHVATSHICHCWACQDFFVLHFRYNCYRWWRLSRTHSLFVCLKGLCSTKTSQSMPQLQLVEFPYISVFLSHNHSRCSSTRVLFSLVPLHLFNSSNT